MSNKTESQKEVLGITLGLLGVIIFSVTLPATRLAVAELNPNFVAGGRAVLAALLGAVYLLVIRSPLPKREHWLNIAMCSAGVVLGFPWLTSLAMRLTDASHGAIVVGALPLATAIAGAWLTKYWPRKPFWAAAFVGAALVIGYVLVRSKATLQWADFLLFGAVISAAVGYAVGAQLTKSLGGLQTISWALIVALPVMLVPAVLYWPTNITAISSKAWLSFAYVTALSQFLGFAFWYRGLAIGGIAKVSQVQLLQVFFSLLVAAWLLSEKIDLAMWAVAAGVVVSIIVARKFAN
jgi:drug/metabolite transporter (DMT)-like permease